jgi:hypothetical protein
VNITDDLLSTVPVDWGLDLLAATRLVDPVQASNVAGQGAPYDQMRGVRPFTVAKR